MAENNKPDSVKEITDKLEQGLKELFDSERFKTYLNTMSKFHNYSFNNTLLIAMQKPDATLVAGFQSWQKNFERHVNKGEKGIKIMAPAPYKKKEEMDVIDPKTQRPVMGEDGKPKREVVEITIPAFKPVTVFDVSQTDGKPVPDLGVSELMTNVEDFKNFMKALERVAPVPVEYMDIASGAKGYFSPSEQKIAIQQGMSESQTVKTAVHETAHSLLHDKDHVRVEGIEDSDKKTRSTKEVEAESVAYTVCQHFGIDTSEYSFGYVAGWSSGKEMTELKESMDTIRKTASQLITGIEDALKEIKLEREQGKEQSKEATYEIWQLKNIPENHELAFESTDHLKAAGKSVERENYELVYSGRLDEDMTLDGLYTKFNIDHPEDFRGHSMSVSDIVVINDENGSHAHYVDSFGFTEVPEFMVERVEVQEQPMPTLFVAECAEFHDFGEHYEGITDVKDAIAKYDAIPADRMNGIKSIGMSVPQPGEPEMVMEIDIMVGHAFDLSMLNYVPNILSNDRAMEMLAELIDHYPEKEILGVMPTELAEKIEQIHEAEPSLAYDLATQIDEFMYSYNPYEYQDQVDDRESQVATLAADLDKGEAGYITQYLQEIVDNQESTPEMIDEAKELIQKVDDYKPLAKIEEQVEENYNHIDNMLNNLKKPSEERAETAQDTENKQEEALEQAESDSGRKTDVEKPKKKEKRPSLKKRLEEKKEQVAAQPASPAPEKTKTNHREGLE